MLQIHFSSYVVIITWLSTKAIKINVDSKMLNVIPEQNSMINNDYNGFWKEYYTTTT